MGRMTELERSGCRLCGEVRRPRTPGACVLPEETARWAISRSCRSAPSRAPSWAFSLRRSVPRRVLEIGVFTGYSSLAVTLALGRDARLTACDVSAEFTAKARDYWRAAGVEDQIDLRLGPAKETIVALLEEGRANLYDMAFIDADKPSYDAYYEGALRLVRPGGLILIDNTLCRAPSPTLTPTMPTRSAQGAQPKAPRRQPHRLLPPSHRRRCLPVPAAGIDLRRQLSADRPTPHAGHGGGTHDHHPRTHRFRAWRAHRDRGR